MYIPGASPGQQASSYPISTNTVKLFSSLSFTAVCVVGQELQC